MYKSLNYFLLAFFLLPVFVFAQKKVDSLKYISKITMQDTTQLILLNNIAKEFERKQIDSALFYYNKVIEIGQPIMLKIPKKSLEYKSIGFSIGKAFNSIGIINKNYGKISEALVYYHKSLKIKEEIGDKIGASKTLNNIGNIYSKQNEVEKAIEYYNKSLKINEEIGDKQIISASLINLGIIYYNKKEVIKALEFYSKSLNLLTEIGYKEGIATTLNNMGIIYKNEGDYSNALNYLFKSLKINEELSNKDGIAQSLNSIGTIYYMQKNYTLAIEYSNKSMSIAKELGFPERIRNSAENLTNIYSEIGNHKLAFDNFQLNIKMRDSINNIETQKSAITQNAKYEYEKTTALQKAAFDKTQDSIKMVTERKIALQALDFEYAQKQAQSKSEEERKQLLFEEEIKRNQIENDFKQKQAALHAEQERKEVLAKAEQEKKDVLTQKEKEKQRLILFSVIAGLLLVVVFAVFMYNRFKTTQKQKQIIELKEKETQQQKYLIEEKHKEITDSINYAERIQRSFLATKNHLDEHLNKMQKPDTSITYNSVTSSEVEKSTGSGLDFARPDNDNVASTLREPQGSATENYFIFFKPKDVVSGDFYWSATLNNGNFILATADSTGHGVPGAIMSLLNITSLEKAVETHHEPSQILNATRKIIIERLKRDGSPEGGKDGMDCSLCVYDFNTLQLHMALANNPVWIARPCHPERSEGSAQSDASFVSMTNYKVIEIKPDKMPVGKHDRQDTPFTTQSIQLQKGDVIYTLTDGFPDQFGGEKGKKFMSKNLRELLAQNANLPMHEQKQLLENIFNNWIGNLEQVDDVTVIGVRV